MMRIPAFDYREGCHSKQELVEWKWYLSMYVRVLEGTLYSKQEEETVLLVARAQNVRNVGFLFYFI